MFPREIVEALEEYWNLRKGETVHNRLLTAGLSIPDHEALRDFESGRFYPVKRYNSTEVVAPNIVPHPKTKSAEEITHWNHDASVPTAVKQYKNWIGKFGPEGSIIIRANRVPAEVVGNLRRGDPRTGRWGRDRVMDPSSHAEVQWLYGVPGIAPNGGELFNPEYIDQMYRAMRTLGMKSVSYEPLRESSTSLVDAARRMGYDIPNKDEHRIALFSRILKRLHKRVGDETGQYPLEPLDDLPERTPRIGMQIRREIRNAKFGDTVRPEPTPSREGSVPMETWEPIPQAVLVPSHARPQLFNWDDIARMRGLREEGASTRPTRGGRDGSRRPSYRDRRDRGGRR